MSVFYHNFDVGTFALEKDLGNGSAYFRRIDPLHQERQYLTLDSFHRYYWSEMVSADTNRRCI